MARTANPKVWAALVVGTVSAAIVVAIMGIALDAGMAVAATPTRAAIEGTDVFAGPSGRIAEGFAVCPGKTRAVGGGVVQSGPQRPVCAIKRSAGRYRGQHGD